MLKKLKYDKDKNVDMSLTIDGFTVNIRTTKEYDNFNFLCRFGILYTQEDLESEIAPEEKKKLIPITVRAVDSEGEVYSWLYPTGKATVVSIKAEMKGLLKGDKWAYGVILSIIKYGIELYNEEQTDCQNYFLVSNSEPKQALIKKINSMISNALSRARSREKRIFKQQNTARDDDYEWYDDGYNDVI